ncbi:MAG: hypothetical protein COA69_03445 [Robiginitomaculum sp.]|nr:MAG: hypothetical protein COA69_03445 [Robiginitomaculum sp.]
MKERFNQPAGETYEKRLAALKEKGNAIDKFLRTPQAPQQQLVPKGQMRQQGLHKARQSMIQNRIHIKEEVKTIQKRLEKQKQQQKEQVRSR